MNCTEFDTQLDDYLSDEMNENVQQAFLAHAADCLGCDSSLALSRNIGATLCAMSVPPASVGFADRVLQQAKKQPSSINGAAGATTDIVGRRSSGFAMGFGSAMVAGMALWAVVALFPSLQEQGTSLKTTPIAEVTIALDQPSDVNLVFNAVAALENANISIDLPSNIALAGFPELRRVEWSTNLVKGRNLLRLPVVATALGQGQTLVAYIKYGEDKVTTLEIKLSVVKPRSQSDLG